MRKILQLAPCLLAALALAGCDAPPRWTSGDYQVYTMNGADELKFGVDVGGGTQGLVMPRVVGIGEDGRWIVVMRHPDGDTTKTEYFYLEKRSRDSQLKGTDAVTGPFSDREFEMKTKELHLPRVSVRF